MSKHLLFTVAMLPAIASAADWPHWMGPARNNKSTETGLLTVWPKTGPQVLWKVPGGDGYGSFAVAGGTVYTMVQREAGEFAIALAAADGKELWATKVGPVFENQYGNGPRSTPAVEAGRVYVQSVSGPVVCLSTEGGKVIWSKDILAEFGAKNITWGLSASPVISGDLVLVIPGGKGAAVAALNKKDGSVAWKTGEGGAAYASPAIATVGGIQQAVFFNAAGVMGVSLPEGKELWQIPWKTDYDCNICTPLVIGDKVFVSSGEKQGCALLELSADGKPGTVWESRGVKGVMTNYWATSVEFEGHLYGLSGEFSNPISLNCVELATGKLVWSKTRFGKGSITLADGHLFITTKTGDLVLVPASPKAYVEKARVKLLGENRSAPVVSDKKLYLRDRANILCLDLAGK